MRIILFTALLSFAVLHRLSFAHSFAINTDPDCADSGTCPAARDEVQPGDPRYAPVNLKPASAVIGGSPDEATFDIHPAAAQPVVVPSDGTAVTKDVGPPMCNPACDPPYECQVGNRCALPADDVTEHDLPPEACMAEGFECRDNEVCAQTNNLGKQCVEAQPLGAACAASELLLCSAGLGCIGGKCVMLLREGSPCGTDPHAVCAGSAEGVICGGHIDRKTCMRPVGLGHPCGKASSRGWICGKGFLCRGSCKKRLRTGQHCGSGVTECPRGTLCAAGKIGRRCVRLAANAAEERQGSWVIFASRAPSVLYWNGARVADNFGSGEYTAVRVHLEIGDVLSFRVFRLVNDTDDSDTLLWNGLIAAVVGKMHGAATGSEQVANWVARTGEDIEGSSDTIRRTNNRKFWYWRARVPEKSDKNSTDWMLPSYNDGFCGDAPSQDGLDWGELDGVDLRGTGDGYARYFPGWTSATYVMAEGADVYDDMHIKVRFGMPRCK